jgi:transposase
MVERVEKEFGPIDVLVNSAGAAKRTDADDLTPVAWRAGMDAKYFSYINVIDPVIKRMGKRGRGAVINIIGSGGKVASLVRWKKGGRFAVEAVGVNRWFVDACRAKGLDIVVVDPARLNLRMLGRKTDRRDAREIARRLALGDIDRCARSYYPTTEEYGVRKLLRTRHKLDGIRKQVVNQVRGLLNAYKLVPPGTSLYQRRCLAWLRACSLPSEDLTFTLLRLTDLIETLQSQIAVFDRRIKDQASKDRASVALQTIPSVGPLTALTLRYELGDVHRFKNARSVACAAGLVPRVSQSADTAHHGPLTKRGNPEVRWILGQWAVRLLTRDPTVRAWAAPRLKRKHKNKVRMALARRLLVGVYFTLRTGEEFSLKRCLAAS